MKLELKHLAAYLPYQLIGLTQKRLVYLTGIDYSNELPLMWKEITGNFVGKHNLLMKTQDLNQSSGHYQTSQKRLRLMVKR